MTYGRVDWHRLQERFEPPPPLTTRGILRLADMVGPTLERIAQCGRLPDPFAPIRLLGDDGRLEIRVGLSILQKTVFLFTLPLCVLSLPWQTFGFYHTMAQTRPFSLPGCPGLDGRYNCSR